MLSSTFQFDGQDFVTLTDEDGVHWIHAGDVCRYLEVKNPSQTVQRHVFPDWRKQISVGPGQPAWFINEPGFYLLTGKVSSPKAEKAQRWFYGVVLPKLRAEGGYISPTATQPQLEALGEQIKEEKRLRQIAEKKTDTYLDLSGLRLKDFYPKLRVMLGSKFKAKEEHFCDVTVDYLIAMNLDASSEQWLDDLGGNKTSEDYYYALDKIILASWQYVKNYQPKALRFFEEKYDHVFEDFDEAFKLAVPVRQGKDTLGDLFGPLP